MKIRVKTVASLMLFAAFVFTACGGGGTNLTYTVTYDSNGGTGTGVPTDTVKYKQGQTVTVQGNSGNLVKTDYTFAGWNTQADGSGATYTEGATFAMGTGNLTLYALWTKTLTYTVTYDGNGGGTGVPTDTGTYLQGQTVTVQGNPGNLIKNGYIFAGWNTQADGNGTTYTEGKTFAMVAANVILYAKWGGPGYKETYTADSVTFLMSFVPGGITFPTGALDNGTPAAVANAYWIGETEVTYELWSKVYVWATGDTDMSGSIDAGETPGAYTFANKGRQGGDWLSISDPVGTIQHPVTSINWRDAMVWCNALTEWYNEKNKTNYTYVYYSDSNYTIPIRTCDNTPPLSSPSDGSQDAPFVKGDATGFRLLTSDEWELAARYIKDNNSDSTLNSSGEYYPGVNASGADAAWDKTPDANDIDIDGDGKVQYTTDVAVFNVSSTAEVKSKGDNGKNALGLYDMSGNVWEWCFEWHVAPPAADPTTLQRVYRGGSWGNDYPGYAMLVSLVNGGGPSYGFRTIGFRFARTK